MRNIHIVKKFYFYKILNIARKNLPQELVPTVGQYVEILEVCVDVHDVEGEE